MIHCADMDWIHIHRSRQSSSYLHDKEITNIIVNYVQTEIPGMKESDLL